MSRTPAPAGEGPTGRRARPAGATQLSLFEAGREAEAGLAEAEAASAPSAPPGDGGGARPPGGASSYIAGIVLDFSREFGDEAHVASNVTQALRLYGDSGQGEQGFAALLYEARRRTRQYQGRQGLGTIDNKMAYFFRVVARLCEV